MALLAQIVVRTCLGDGESTFRRMMAGAVGARPLDGIDADLVNVGAGYQITGTPAPSATELLLQCLAPMAEHSEGPRPVVIGTGLREVRPIERWALGEGAVDAGCLDFGKDVTAKLPGLWPVTTISNACSASGHALAIAQDMVDSGEAAAVVAAGVDVVAASMLAMIGRVSQTRTARVRPFDTDRTGVLLGDGAAAALVVPDDWTGPVVGRLLATGLSCDAFHETAPSEDGIVRAMRDAHRRGGRAAADVDLIVAHGTGTALNDPVELGAIAEVFGTADAGPLVTAGKGAVGHTSGAAALVSLDLAARTLTGDVPAIAGLVRPIAEATGIRLVRSPLRDATVNLVQVNAFGFGGVNAVTLLERIAS